MRHVEGRVQIAWRGMQVALQGAEEGNAALRLRITDANQRLADMAELRSENLALQRKVEELSREQQARLALEAKIGRQQEEVSSFARWANHRLSHEFGRDTEPA